MQTRLTFFALVAATFISLLALSAYAAGVGGVDTGGGGSPPTATQAPI
jgi:hypothetical protein